MALKEWVTVQMYKGVEIRVLNGAEEGDEMGYKTFPAMTSWDALYPTVADAIESIDKFRSMALDDKGRRP
ncbi:MAG: hypothetical protein K0Q73_4049 [Paenibacillus sp.]|nr:hypothetical protein [Paenibacillus sp.]